MRETSSLAFASLIFFMKFKRRQEDGFNLSFLDVMACGLGAVILIFILVDFNGSSPDPNEELSQLKTELLSANQAQADLQGTIDNIDREIANIAQQQKNESATQSNTQSEQAELLQQLSTQLAVIADLEKQLAAVAKIETPDANIKLDGVGEQNYITGLKVEGKHIGILIDKSASMIADNLLDVLRLMVKPDGEKQQLAKWQRTKRVAKWLLARLPETSQVTTVAFSDTAQVLGLRAINSPAASDSLKAISDDIDAIVPSGGTNLQLGMAELFAANDKITDVYLITDGLPTLGDGLGVSCRNILSRQQTISSKCRQQLMVETIKRFPSGYKVNVILLPIDGDPYASSMYWSWTQVLGGTFLSPAKEWP